MFERSIVIGSASKTFAVTGWRIGWAYGPSNLIGYMKQANEFTVLCNTTPLQVCLITRVYTIYLEECLEFGELSYEAWLISWLEWVVIVRAMISNAHSEPDERLAIID